MAGGSVVVAKEVKPRLWRRGSRAWRAALMALLALMAWRAPRPFAGPWRPGRQAWQLLPAPERRWLALGVLGLLGGTALQLWAPVVVSRGLMAAARGAKVVELRLLALVAMGVALCNGVRAYAFHVTRLGFVEALRERAFRCYLRLGLGCP